MAIRKRVAFLVWYGLPIITIEKTKQISIMNLLFIYLGAIVLKLVGVPVIKDIAWKWFILAPFIYLLYKVVFKSIWWMVCLTGGCFMIYGIAKFFLWALAG